MLSPNIDLDYISKLGHSRPSMCPIRLNHVMGILDKMAGQQCCKVYFSLIIFMLLVVQQWIYVTGTNSTCRMISTSLNGHVFLVMFVCCVNPNYGAPFYGGPFYGLSRYGSRTVARLSLGIVYVCPFIACTTFNRLRFQVPQRTVASVKWERLPTAVSA